MNDGGNNMKDEDDVRDDDDLFFTVTSCIFSIMLFLAVIGDATVVKIAIDMVR